MSSLNAKSVVDDVAEKCSLTMLNEMDNPNGEKVIITEPVTVVGQKKKSPITINMELLKNLDEKSYDFSNSESGPSITSSSKNIKQLDIGFTNLMYSVKTLLNRGEFSTTK